ncbi:type IV pilin protein [Oceanisphaera pacifica]|uniref:Prepilin-type N-terminal cleavage/methylation domain-containing protein n=1 Tax=Oceanisphaera pacifica TaxID=2818389 RepID=A0ABS3NGE1_9GAMM|nr:type IV pilin protein [Oceanisphaera pacifica]MBO1519345.1 prepilin-type N-terminal cleavage/methylation domain-containing protein [Oceanisphaera pacifica]
MKRIRGFSLIELLIAMAIVAILALVAYPSLSHYLVKSKRMAAMQTLYALQLQQEKWRVTHASYASQTEASAHFLPTHQHYVFTVSNASAHQYRLTASAKQTSAQYQDKAGNTACHTLSLDSNNTKTPVECW